ncbi:efflux RND transporter periplasmic adaptor subunit [Haloferula chungangensis]|uniref:Efflux RND transporter periplasmic adaptor subunit n=1 Tax=Haloferula chungangensis TaxID=1048331 RepID=A0ABW2LCF8_9BACT
MNISLIKNYAMRRKVLIPAAAMVMAWGTWAAVSGGGKSGAEQVEAYYKAEQGSFTIALPTGGSLEAVNEVKIRNKVPGRTRIISMVQEGSVVAKGDLLIELDSNDIENQLSQSEIAYQQSLAQVAELEERYDSLESENVIKLRDAKLALEFAKNDLKKYNEGQFPQLKKKADSAINLASEELRRAQDRLDGTRRLEEKGYVTPSELVVDELAVKRREIELQSAEEERRLLITFDAPRNVRLLESNVGNAEVRLERTTRQNETQLEKLKMQLASARETLSLRERKLADLRDAEKFTKIYAPESGLVIYENLPSWRGGPIEEGSEVRERQELLSLPDVSQMKVRVNIYENQISLVKPGMQATVSLDALPDQVFSGEVTAIASMPEPARDGNPNYRVYKAEVLVTDKMPEIKPGVTAKVDILVAELDDVIKVPLQSVVGLDDRQYCFIEKNGEAEAVEVEIGLFDSDFVEIRNGLTAGDLVSLVPPSSRDFLSKEKDGESGDGDVITDDQLLSSRN